MAIRAESATPDVVLKVVENLNGKGLLLSAFFNIGSVPTEKPLLKILPSGTILRTQNVASNVLEAAGFEFNNKGQVKIGEQDND